MKRFKNIAIFMGETHEGDCILTRAVELATFNQATMSVYAMFDQASHEPDTDRLPFPMDEVFRQVKEVKEQRLEAAMRPFQEAEIPVSGKLLAGKPFIRVIQEVLKNGHDLLMLPADKGRSDFSLFLGGTPMHLLRKCPCAVWVFQAQRKRKHHRIMAAVDVSAEGEEEVELNIKVMELATSMAEQEDAELHVVHCWDSFDESMLVNMAGLSGEDRRSYVKDSKLQHREQLRNFLLGFPIDKSRTHTHLLKGNAGDLIPGLAVRQSIELLVMGTAARSGIPGFFIGNTAEKILNHVPCSVLAVKPSGFVTPVQPERP